MSNIEQILTKLTRERFYGTLEIKMESGKVVLLRKTETIKPLMTSDNYRDNRGESHENQPQR